ncbi:efflux RND transporter periplasmic adaptor subunit [Bradyrhizobium sp. LHD-71]|uniref:efflux RND transporter periplasmic adaptor subunit n=1 Tax=Bradyrhizobium sp. LHD-71 TaxID=3072141 RepID=UPI00280E4314|nr:efflux RND transporter periplasmic adaptor subunit [Bradyrhizobium sp. LHD-71]MDQ8729595.1 efflux RND transporter periplasmic adaptor subunit [Bradyrhizobium sp. LHD-71]
MLSSLASALAAGVLIAGLLLGGASAHEGHDHGEPAVSAPASVAMRGEATSENIELVAVAQGEELIVYLDRFDTNAPVANAVIEVETPDGPAKAEAKDDGTYRLSAPWLAKGGHLDLIFTVTVAGATDILPLAIDVRAAEAGAEKGDVAGGLKARGLLSSNVAGAALLGILIGAFAMALGRRRRTTAMLAITAAVVLVAPSLAHEGNDSDESRMEAPATDGTKLPAPVLGDRAARLPDGTIFIPKSVQRIFGLRTAIAAKRTYKPSIELPGRIIPDPNASGFVQSAIGGRLAPPPGGFPQLGQRVKRGDVLAYVTPPMQSIDVSDMRQRQGELDQQIAIVERRLKRQETLAPSGAVAQAQVEETRLELQGLRDRRVSLDRIRREPEELVAPVSGVVAEGRPVAGQIVQSNAVIYQIVDPAKLWIEALSFQSLRDVKDASARTGAGTALTIAFKGSGFADRSQSIPVHFAVERGAEGLRAGEFVTVFAHVGTGKEGIALPRSAVIRAANGQDFIYEHVSPERFEARPVRTEPLDGDRVLIAAGIDAGKRVVVQGAELVGHVR